MKLKYINAMLIIQTLILIGGLVFAWDGLTENVDDLFVGALGLLTFISIFYSFTISSGIQVIQNVKMTLKKEQNKKIEETLKKILKAKNKMEKLPELDDLKTDIDKIEIFIDYLDLNKWLFISVSGYFISIIFYLLPTQGWTTAFQILSFWTGVTVSALIVTSWFAANEIQLGE